MRAGTTYAPEGSLLDELGATLPAPAEQPALRTLAQCCALCNDSTLYFAAGEAFEAASTLWGLLVLLMPRTLAQCSVLSSDCTLTQHSGHVG